MSRHESFMNRAIGVALTSNCRWRHGSVIAKGSRLVAYSNNIHRNDPEQGQKNSSWHAERAALRSLDRSTGVHYDLPGTYEGYSLYVARVNTKNEPKMSRPCKDCFEWIVYKGIRDIYYTNEVGGLSNESVTW